MGLLLKTGPGVHIDFSKSHEDVRQDLHLGSARHVDDKIFETSFGSFFDGEDQSKVTKEHTLQLPLPKDALENGRGGLQVLHFAPGSLAQLMPFQQLTAVSVSTEAPPE